MKKRKLNSKNPKYFKREEVKIKSIKKLLNETKNFKIYAVFEEQISKKDS